TEPPAACTSRILLVTARSTLVLRPPHRPLSVVTTMKPTAFGASVKRMKGEWYSGFAVDRLAVMLRILSAYGRAWRIRSCALRIFDADTSSIAFVIFFVFSKDLILPRISLPTAISKTPLACDQANAADPALPVRWCCPLEGA